MDGDSATRNANEQLMMIPARFVLPFTIVHSFTITTVSFVPNANYTPQIDALNKSIKN